MTNTYADVIRLAVGRAEEQLYKTLADNIPEIQTGDVSPGEVMALRGELESAAQTWIENNYPQPEDEPEGDKTMTPAQRESWLTSIAHRQSGGVIY